jgi:hypothetical protein
VLRFPARRDAWLTALLWAAAALTAVAAAAVWATPASLPARLLTALACVTPMPFVLWMIYGTRYAIEADALEARSGPVRVRIPFAEIASVAPARGLTLHMGWSLATSLDRLLVRRRGGGMAVAISPADRTAFLSALAARCPRLALEGDRLVERA